jgi:hypothetical protein
MHNAGTTTFLRITKTGFASQRNVLATHTRILPRTQTYFETSQQWTEYCRGSPGLSEIAVRFLKHDFRAENSYHSLESLWIGR